MSSLNGHICSLDLQTQNHNMATHGTDASENHGLKSVLHPDIYL